MQLGEIAAGTTKINKFAATEKFNSTVRNESPSAVGLLVSKWAAESETIEYTSGRCESRTEKLNSLARLATDANNLEQDGLKKTTALMMDHPGISRVSFMVLG